MFLAELPTTGAVSFTDFCADPAHSYTVQLAEATQARANLRAILKESKRTDGEKDYLRLVKVLDDYLPHLCGIIACVSVGDLTITKTPIFSWRTTLSANLLNNSPRTDVPTLYADLAFSLITYGFALTNLARATVLSLGSYEHNASLPEAERKACDERLNFAVTLLCKASGVFQHITDSVIGDWEVAVGAPASTSRPLELTREVNTALSKMTLGDAQSLAIRKLMTKAAAESALSPGPPLPRTHPSPSLLAKLHLEAAAQFLSARALAKTPAASSQKSRILLPGRDKGADEVAGELRRYLSGSATLHSALAYKWFGVDAGETKAGARTGVAVGFLTWARSELDELRDGGGKSLGGSERDRAMRDERKGIVQQETSSVDAFYTYYKNMNNTLNFQPVPPQPELQALIPAGRLAVTIKVYQLPAPAFGPGSKENIERQARALELDASQTEGAAEDASSRGYAGAGEYF